MRALGAVTGLLGLVLGIRAFVAMESIRRMTDPDRAAATAPTTFTPPERVDQWTKPIHVPTNLAQPNPATQRLYIPTPPAVRY